MNATHFSTKLVEQFNNEIKTPETLEQLKATAALLWKVLGLTYYVLAFAIAFTYAHSRPVYLSLKDRYTTWRMQNDDALGLEIIANSINSSPEQLQAEAAEASAVATVPAEILNESESVVLPIEVNNSVPTTSATDAAAINDSSLVGGLATEELEQPIKSSKSVGKTRTRKQS